MIPPLEEVLDSLSEAGRKLVSAALKEVNRKYGPKSLEPKAYHDITHSIDVVIACWQLAQKLSINTHETELLLIAAAHHDIVHDQSVNDEEQSAQIAKKHVQAYTEYKPRDAERVTKIILATRWHLEDGAFVQEADQTDTLQQIIADADLSSFGRPFHRFWDRSQAYFAEYNPSKKLEGQVLKQFTEQQIKTLARHTYLLAESRELFAYKSSNIKRLNELLSSKNEA